MKHNGPISGIATHGNLIATAGYDNQIILWDALVGRAIARGCHDHLVNQVCFNSQGTLLASASSDHSVRLWDVPTMRLRTLIVSHDDDVEMVAFSPDGQKIATCSRDRSVRVFTLSGEKIAQMLGHSDDVIAIAWINDGNSVISSSDDGSVRTWDSQTGKQIGSFEADEVQTDALVVTSLGQIFVGDDKGQLVLLRSDGGHHVIKAHAAGIKRLVLNEKYRLLASLSYDRSMAIWSLSDYAIPHEIARTDFPAVVWPRSAAFLNEKLLVTATFGSRYATYNFTTRTWCFDGIEKYRSLNAVSEFQGSIFSIGDSGTLFKDGESLAEMGSLCNFLLPIKNRLLTGGQMGKIFDALTGEVLYQHHSPINCGAAFQRRGEELVAFGSYTGELIILKVPSSGQDCEVSTHLLHDNAIKGVAADKQQLFSVSATAEAVFTDIEDLRVTVKLSKAHFKIANGCVAIKKGFASVSRDGYLRLWQSMGVSCVRTPHRNSIKCIAVDTSGVVIATGSYGGSIFVFDILRHKWIYGERPTAAGISNLLFSSQRNTFFASSYDGYVYEVPLKRVFETDGLSSFIADEAFWDIEEEKQISK